ncbi:MAG: 3-dehydroquinate dehydratase [Gammaproteobacteria bacterium]|nr:MAG: 3-dehydroquinate dehydratase [Gammaproteobacteria bacterium]
MATILLLNGPNLNLLGSREKSIYGELTLDSISKTVEDKLADASIKLVTYQSNHEGYLVDRVQRALTESIALIIFNPAAYTHTSVALRDALLAVEIPFIEVHLSEPKEREAFRHISYFSDIALEVISGKGAMSYTDAAEAAINYLNKKD